jgi:hypothetical protein
VFAAWKLGSLLSAEIFYLVLRALPNLEKLFKTRCSLAEEGQLTALDLSSLSENVQVEIP